LLIGAFLILAPASVSGGDSDDTTWKWVRVGILVAATLVGARWFRLPSLSDLSGKIMLMAVVFTVAAIWSTSPVWGLLFKGMFICAICASVSLANCLRSEADFRILTRTLTFAAFVATIIVLYLIVVAEDYVVWNGRLVLSQINANSLGLSAAIFALLCLFHLLIGDRRGWRVLAITAFAVMTVLIVYSGSRAAALTVISGIVILLPGLGTKRRSVVAFSVCSLLSLMAVAVVWFGLPDEETEGPYGFSSSEEANSGLRIFQEFTKDTRMGIWSGVTNRWLNNDFALGAGWLHRNNRWTLVQSSYLQVVVEAGIPGLLCVALFLFGGASTLLRALRQAQLDAHSRAAPPTSRARKTAVTSNRPHVVARRT
jgi:O-antigen ligase